MKKTMQSLVVSSLFLSFGIEISLHAATVVDQQQPVIDLSVGGLAIGGNSQQKLAQVVTAGITGSLTEVRFPITCDSADLTIEIQGVTNGMPDGNVLTSETFNGTNLPGFIGPVGFRSFPFSSPVSFSAGDQFAIVLESSGDTPTNGCGVFSGPPGDSYPGGQGWFRGLPNNLNVWVCLCDFTNSFDLPFQTLVTTSGPLGVAIDIRPGEFPNNINTKSNGKIAVSILSATRFNAVTDVNRQTLTFGATGNEASLVANKFETTDVNGDGLPDLTCFFYTSKTEFQRTDTRGILKGRTTSDQPFEGSDSVRIVH